MNIVQRQVWAWLVALLVAGLLLAGTVASLAAPSSCTEGEVHGAPVPAVQLTEFAHADTTRSADFLHAAAGCCSAAATSCCASSALMFASVTERDEPLTSSVWFLALQRELSGLGYKVDLHPPRLG